MGQIHRRRGASAALILGAVVLTGPSPARGSIPLGVTQPILRRLNVPLARLDWMWSGYPVDLNGQPSVPQLVSKHARLQWFNPAGTNSVHERDLDPTLSDARGTVQHPALEIDAGSPTGQLGVTPGDWSGLTHALATSAQDLSGLGYLEIWVNDFHADHTTTRCTLHLDFGHVSEDAFWSPDSVPNNELDTEDKNRNNQLDTGSMADAEDTGLDGLFDGQEPGYNPQTNPDPDHDDYHYDSNHPSDYSGINNYEGNGRGVPDARPDTEDLNRNGYLDVANRYLEATIDLADTTRVTPLRTIVVDVPADYAGDPDVRPGNGWRLYRLPITDDAYAKFGPAATWRDIEHMRIWMDGMTDSMSLQIGGISFGDPSLKVSGVRSAALPAYPNPFRTSTAIEFNLMQPGPTRLRIFDIHGRLIRELIDEELPAAGYRATWDGKDSSGRAAASGIYIYRLDAPGVREARRVILLR